MKLAEEIERANEFHGSVHCKVSRDWVGKALLYIQGWVGPFQPKVIHFILVQWSEKVEINATKKEETAKTSFLSHYKLPGVLQHCGIDWAGVCTINNKDYVKDDDVLSILRQFFRFSCLFSLGLWQKEKNNQATHLMTSSCLPFSCQTGRSCLYCSYITSGLLFSFQND